VFLAKHADLRTEAGQQRVVRHGHLPEREIMAGIGPVAVRQPRVRDREAAEGGRVRYSPSILPRYARRSNSLEVLIPILDLKGISTVDFGEALAALVGKSLPLQRQGTRQVYRRRPSPASRRRGARSMRAGRSAICQQSGFAVRADDTVGATERAPKPLVLNNEILTPGALPQLTIAPGTATLIATGGMVPRGADAVIMVEHTETRDDVATTVIKVRRAAAAGQFIAFAGSDLARGETVLRAGQVLTSREIGMLATVGCAAVEVWRRPLIAIISTGDEIVAPGQPIRPGAGL
jgi:hypothetical protein